MEESFEPYHVPQQSRRDKLRIMAQNQPTPPLALSAVLPLHDASSFSYDLLSCAAVSGNTPGGHEFHHPYLDPQSSLPLNPSTVQDINNNPFLYSTAQHLQNPREYGHSYNNNNNNGGGEVAVYKSESLSISLSNSHYTHSNNFPLDQSAIYSDKVTATGYMVPSINGASCSTSNEVSRYSVPLGPFTGYASILKGSGFLRPAQQLLEELCDVGKVIHSEKASLMEPPLQNLSDTGGGDGGDNGRKKPRLSSILDEVYRQYKQCYQQMQAVVASFECVSGLGNAAPYANLAMKAMSKQFRYLKNAITEHIQFTNKAHGHISPGKIESPRFGSSDGSLYNRAVQDSRFLQNQPVWHPQRGLPERAVAVLRAWLFEHFLHPYPTDTDKVMLAKQTGLSRNQVSNWFINARVRLWKPMVEEMHMLEMRQAQKALEKDRNANKLSDHMPSAENPSMSTQRIEGNNTSSKRTRSELPDAPVGSEVPNLSYNNCFSSHPHASGNSGVSLTLGLHQNNGIGLSEPFPINAAQRFGLGLEVSSEGYVIGGFEAQNRHFGRDVGGQILRDFVG